MATVRASAQLDARWRGGPATKAAGRDIEQLDRNTKSTGISFRSLATTVGAAVGAIGAAGIAAKQFYNVLQAGAQVQAAALTFDNLASSIGATSDAMLGDLRGATQGMVSDLDLMRSSNQFVAMGLANTSDEAGRLAEIGATLGAAFRGDAVGGMEEFALLLANQSIPRLDTFGISAGAVRTRIKELQDEFPDMTRETAFMQAVLEEADKTMGKLGDSSETAAAELAKLEASAKNAKDSFLAATTQGFLPTVRALNELVAATNRSSDSLTFWETFAEGVAINFAPLTGSIQTATIALRGLATVDFSSFSRFLETFTGAGTRVVKTDLAFERAYKTISGRGGAGRGGFRDAEVGAVELGSALGGLNKEIGDTDTSILRINQRARTLVGNTEDLAGAFDNWAGDIEVATDELEDNAEAIDRNAQRQEILARNTRLAQEAARGFNATLGDYFVQISSAEKFTFDANEELYNLVAAGDASAETMAGLATALGIMTEAEAEAFLRTTILRGELMELAQAVIDGDVSMDDAAEAARGLAAGFFDTYEDALRAAEAARILKSDLDKIPRNITVTVDVVTGGAVVQQDGSGPGLTERAGGGSVGMGQPFLVGEQGPELFVPQTNGTIISAGQTRAALGGPAVGTLIVNLANPINAPAKTVATMVAAEVGRRLGRG